jgi:hypothetical protein
LNFGKNLLILKTQMRNVGKLDFKPLNYFNKVCVKNGTNIVNSPNNPYTQSTKFETESDLDLSSINLKKY